MRRNGMTSITSQVRRSVASITVLLAVPAVIGLAVMLMYSARTQAMIRRMDAAARMKPVLESTIAENLFSVAAGRCGYADSGVEELITGTNDTLDMLLSETEGSGQMQLTIARRTMDTLEQYVHKVRDGMDAGTPISEIEGIVDEVRNVGRLVADMLDAFTTEEISNATDALRRLRTIVMISAAAEILLLLIAFGRTRSETRKLTESIHTSIYSLEETVRRIAEGNFGDRVREPGQPVPGGTAYPAGPDQSAFPLQHAGYHRVAGGIRERRGSRAPDEEPQRLFPDFAFIRGRLDPGEPGAEARFRLPEHPEDPVPGHPGL